jgi:uncharacterized phage protein (TIGR01671 family)
MREILFRGKRVDSGEWVEGDLIHGVGSKAGKMFILPIINIYPKGCNELDGWEANPETVGQFTGLTDKNGVKIWENDIVSILQDEEPEISEVRFAEGGFVVEAHFGDYDMTTIGWAFSMVDEIEVIGNIHDNENLMK